MTQPSTLPILFQDNHYVAVNKPAGLLVHRTKIDRHETRFALQTLRDQIGAAVYPLHRLDKPTSGVLLFGRSSRDVSALAGRFDGGGGDERGQQKASDQPQVEKQYLAVVRGYAKQEDRINHPLLTERGKQEAVTSYRSLATVELPHAVGRYATARYSLVLARPESGRTHQLRRHFKHIFHPIIGDRKYGDDRHTRFFEAHFGSDRLLLHAVALQFRHPFTGDDIAIVAPPDASIMSVVGRLGWAAVLEETLRELTRNENRRDVRPERRDESVSGGAGG